MAKRKGMDGVDKKRIITLLKNAPVKTKDICRIKDYIGLQDFLCERDKDKYSIDDVLMFLTEQTIKCLTTEYSKSSFPKYLYSVCAFMDLHIDREELSDEEFENSDLPQLNESTGSETEKKYKTTITPLIKSIYLEIKKIKPLYDEFKKNNPKYFDNEEETKIIDELVSEIEEVVEKISPDITNKLLNENDNEQTPISILQELNDEIKALSAKIKELENEKNSLSSKNDKLDKLNKKQQKEIIELKNKLKELEQKYNELLKEEKKQLDLETLLKEIEELKNRIQELENENQELLEIKKKYETLQSSHQLLSDKLKSLQESHSKLQNSYKGVRKHRDSFLNTSYDFESQRSEIASLKKKCGDLQRDVSRLTQRNNELLEQIETQNALSNEDVINKRIQKIIIENLIQRNCSIDELLEIIKTNGYDINIEELYKQITSIKKELRVITISYNSHNLPIIGMDQRAKINGSLNLSLPCNNTSRILIISNTLLNREPDDLVKIIDDIYDYCVKNNIHYIFNIGNLFSINNNELLSINELRSLQKQLEIIIKRYPLDSSVNNILLGSTSDLNITRYGIDPIDFLVRERMDFQYLGYKTGKIELNNPDNKMLLAEPMIDCNENTQREKIVEYLSKYKAFDLRVFGSNYDSMIDTTNNFITVPPIYNSEILNGATELDISFNASGDIEEVLCIPLIIDKILLPTSYVYIKK